jgi:hypothetical protein
MLDQAAQVDMVFNWQHPLAFDSGVGTDVISHPLETDPSQDAVSVDPKHIMPTSEYIAGYFISIVA